MVDIRRRMGSAATAIQTQRSKGVCYQVLYQKQNSGSKLQLQPLPKKRRGPTRCKNVIDAKTLLPLRVNKFGQPIGPESGTYTNYLGTLARKGELAPLCYKTWWEMPKRLNEDMWNIVKENMMWES
ncbi:uncharacterized protein LOC132268458 [Cornus florida]|uniref:uncharacterized protein LOC132268458 n=1 Tax=Cornus florida TaxID=4283 RepID=UPI00289EC16B|nr:uncharacterized protein LOC132268458 [Cornus florida]